MREEREKNEEKKLKKIKNKIKYKMIKINN